MKSKLADLFGRLDKAADAKKQARTDAAGDVGRLRQAGLPGLGIRAAADANAPRPKTAIPEGLNILTAAQ